MDQPALAEGLEHAFRGIVRLKARAAALACLADLSTVADAFQQEHPACNPQVLDQAPPAFPLKLDDPKVIKQLENVGNACQKLAAALKSIDPSALDLIGQIPENLVYRGPWGEELRHWVKGKAGEFFPVQDYEEEVDFCGTREREEERLVPKGPVPDEAPMVLRLAHVAAIMACLSRESRAWAGAAARDENYSRARETLESKAERKLIRGCGAVLLRHGQGLSHLKEIAEAVFVWGLGGKPGEPVSPCWQTRAFKEIRKGLRHWWENPNRDDGLPF